jgi:hypothetical protein
MRASQQAPSLDSIPAATGGARLTPFSRLPLADRHTVAVCGAPFEEFLARAGVRGVHRHRVLEGGGYRAVGVELTSGRHALLVKYDERSEFDITLDVLRGLHVHRQDFYEVFKVLGVPSSSIKFCDGAILWK